MTPTKQGVEISKLTVKLVVFFWTDQNHFVQTADDLPDRFRERMNSRVRTDPFAVLHTDLEKFACDPPIDINASNDERAKKISFTAFIDAEMRFEHFRRMHL